MSGAGRGIQTPNHPVRQIGFRARLNALSQLHSTLDTLRATAIGEGADRHTRSVCAPLKLSEANQCPSVVSENSLGFQP